MICLTRTERRPDRGTVHYVGPLHSRPANGGVTRKPFAGAEADLIRNIQGIAEVAGLDGDELGYLLGKVAEARRVD